MGVSEDRKLISQSDPPSYTSEKDKELRWGWGRFTPECLQFLNNYKWFMFFIMIFNMFQVMNGVFTFAALPTLEKQFGLSSKMSGLIAASNDITGLVLLPFVSHFGETRHKPRWLGIGALVSMLGGIVFTIPQAIVGNVAIQVEEPVSFDNMTNIQMCSADNSFMNNLEKCEAYQNSSNLAYVIFIIARLLMGAGSTPVFSLGISFIDDNANPKYVSICLGLFFSALTLAISLGFASTGIILGQVYVEIPVPEHLEGITPADPRWIGNWWISFGFSSVMLLFAGLVLMAYPRQLPGAEERKRMLVESGELRPTEKKTDSSMRGLLIALWKLISNLTYITQTLAKICVSAFWAGIVPFIFKIIQQNFGTSARETGLGTAMITGPGLGGGVILGSIIANKLRLKESLQKAAKWCFILQLFGLLGSLPWLIPGCDVVKLAGVTTPYSYQNSSLASVGGIDNTCNSNCACDLELYSPVCGADDVTYYSPCYAGCEGAMDDAIFSNCTCISSSISKLAYKGECDRNCKNAFLFMGICTIGVILAQLNNIAGQVVLLRSVPENCRSLGMGLQPIFTKLFGNLPGPLIYGYFIDKTCILWSTTCGKQGNCLEYDVESLVIVIVIGATAVQVLSLFLLFVSWMLSKKIQDSEQGREEVETDENTNKPFMNGHAGLRNLLYEINNNTDGEKYKHEFGSARNLQLISCI